MKDVFQFIHWWWDRAEEGNKSTFIVITFAAFIISIGVIFGPLGALAVIALCGLGFVSILVYLIVDGLVKEIRNKYAEWKEFNQFKN